MPRKTETPAPGGRRFVCCSPLGDLRAYDHRDRWCVAVMMEMVACRTNDVTHQRNNIPPHGSWSSTRSLAVEAHSQLELAKIARKFGGYDGGNLWPGQLMVFALDHDRR